MNVTFYPPNLTQAKHNDFVIPTPHTNFLKLKGEEFLAHRVALMLRRHYPSVVYRFDIAADLKIVPNLAKRVFARTKAKYGHRKGYPDLFVAKKSLCGQFSGLYVELKLNRSDWQTKKGTLRQNKHVLEQYFMHTELARAGYAVLFADGDGDMVFHVLRNYLGKPERSSPDCSA